MAVKSSALSSTVRPFRARATRGAAAPRGRLRLPKNYLSVLDFDAAGFAHLMELASRLKSERRMGRAIADRRDAVFLMTKVCTHGRDAKVAMRQLDESLRRLRTDHLDLWQIHECVYYNDPERHFARGGVVEALERERRLYGGCLGHAPPTPLRSATGRRRGR